MVNRPMKTYKTMLAVGMFLLAVASYMPAASAHECTAEKGEPNEADCSTPCTEGEDHQHKVTHYHENGLGDDYNHVHYDCTSHRDDNEDPPCDTPRVLGICIIGGGETATVEAVLGIVKGCLADTTARYAAPGHILREDVCA